MGEPLQKVFMYGEADVRTVEIDGEAWFVGKDVAEVLGYSNPQKAIRDHIDSDDKTVNDSFTVNGTPPLLINESGLYSLILRSRRGGREADARMEGCRRQGVRGGAA